MKRKVKFQEGGVVEEPARRPAPRSNYSRMSAAARARQAEASAAARQEIERLNAQRDIEDFNRRVQRGTVNADTMRRMGAQPLPPGTQDFTTSPDGTTRRGTATGREVMPYREPGVPATQGGRGVVPPGQGGAPRQIPLFPSGRPQLPGPVASAARRLFPGLGFLDAVSPTSLEAGAEFEREGLRQAREEAARAQEAESIPPPPPPAPPVPAARPRQAARPAAPSNEISAQRMNELMDGGAPANEREREVQANIMARRRSLEAAGTAFKKGGMVKPKAKPVAKKAGGMIGKPKAAPKKMMKGGVVAKPKSKAKPMPFKKGGVIKKGRK